MGVNSWPSEKPLTLADALNGLSAFTVLLPAPSMTPVYVEGIIPDDHWEWENMQGGGAVKLETVLMIGKTSASTIKTLYSIKRAAIEDHVTHEVTLAELTNVVMPT
jgi:hypothetical protein